MWRDAVKRSHSRPALDLQPGKVQQTELGYNTLHGFLANEEKCLQPDVTSLEFVVSSMGKASSLLSSKRYPQACYLKRMCMCKGLLEVNPRGAISVRNFVVETVLRHRKAIILSDASVRRLLILVVYMSY